MHNKTIHVLMVACKFEAGGAPRSMMDMILNLQKNHNVKVTLAVSGDDRLAEWCRNQQIDYFVCGHDIFAVAKENGIRATVKRFLKIPLVILRNKKAIKTIERQLDFNTIDIIHTNSNRDNFGALLARRHNIPHVWHLREYGKQDYDVRFYFPFSIRFMNATTKRFIAISNGVRQAWINRGIKESNISKIYNGINTDKIISKQDFYSLRDNLKIIFTGSLFAFKGQLELINALSLLPSSIQNDITVDFFYESVDLEYQSVLYDTIQNNNLKSHINFCGSTNDIGKLLQNYNVGATCSKSEAFGRVTVEYMAAGLITIASNTGANPEIIEDRKNGFLYEYGNQDSLSRILEKIFYMGENEKQQIGQAAIERVDQNFTDKINAKNVYGLYLDILKDRRNN